MAKQPIMRERRDLLRTIINKNPSARQIDLRKEMIKTYSDYSKGMLNRDLKEIGAFRDKDGYSFFIDQKIESAIENNRSKIVTQLGYIFKWDDPIFRRVFQKNVAILHIFFRDNASVDFTAKKIAELFDTEILGITIGFRVVSIYVNEKNEALAIQRQLESFKK